MDKKIAVPGAGAIGSSVGADLAQAGYDVAIKPDRSNLPLAEELLP